MLPAFVNCCKIWIASVCLLVDKQNDLALFELALFELALFETLYLTEFDSMHQRAMYA